MQSYAGTIEILAARIRALVPDHPEILSMTSAFDLFTVQGFQCDDLSPSLAQAGGALGLVQAECRRKGATT